MSAPPQHAVVDLYDDDGFDWEAAVEEIDRACAIASASVPDPAPAPVQHPLPPQGFDWEAAVEEIDRACALASSSAPAPAPLHRPPAAGGGAARQATLDRFVDSFTKRRLEKESPPPAPAQAAPPRGLGADPGGIGGVGPPGVPAGEGCSRQADQKAVEDRFLESFTRRQREKQMVAEEVAPAPGGGWGRPAAWEVRAAAEAAPAPAGGQGRPAAREKERAAAEVAPAPAPAGGRGRPAARAGRGGSGRGQGRGRGRGKRAGNACSHRPNVEVEYNPCAIALDHEAVKTWTYPTNVEVREYQKYMVEKALFTNALIALPTGLGKTFIAAVVMYNYFRWFPEGKIIFTCPSRPLVTQQIEACYNTVGIPQEWIIDMIGTKCPSTRSVHWNSKRVFFVTPQVLRNDIQSGICMVQKIVCLVIDEAHRASGNYAYCTVVQELLAARVPLRILALTATPGSKHAAIQGVIDNLSISELIYCDEEDSRVNQYVNTRKVDVVEVPSGSDATEVADMLLDIMRPHLNRLRDAGVIDHRDYANWTQFDLKNFKDKFKEAPPPNIHEIDRGEIERSFVILGPLCHTRRLLLSHGTKFAHGHLDQKLKGGFLNLMRKNDLFWRLKQKMKLSSSQGTGMTPKVEKLKGLVIEHFGTDSNSTNSRIIIFSHYRESVNEIYCSLQNIDDKLIRPVKFVGQSSAGNRQLKGQSQKTQQAILQKFRSGVYNVLVATSIGEEGLDIIEVDLVICFDANVSPLRMIQRMGRTGRKNDGRVVVLAYQGQELQGYRKKQRDCRTMRKLLHNSERFEYHASPRMVPHVYKPEVKYVKLTIDKYIHHLKKMRGSAKEASSIPWKISEADSQMIARYFGACKEEVWRPSLVAFPSLQLYPSVVHKVPHSFRTTDMLTDAMQQLQDPSLFRTECEIHLEEPANVSAVEEGLEHEGIYAVDGNEEMPQECDGSEALPRVVWNENVSVPGSPVKKYPIHTFFSGDYVTVDIRGSVSITFVPVLPQKFAFSKDIKNTVWNNNDQSKAKPYRSAAGVSRTTVQSVHPVANTDKHMFVDNVSTVAMHSPEYSGHCDNVDDNHMFTTVPPKTLTSPREKMDTPCSVKLPESTYTYQEDMELSPRLTVYMEEGIVPESPLMDEAADFEAVPKQGSPKSRDERAHANVAGCHKEPLNFKKNGQLLSGANELGGSSRLYVLDQSQAKIEELMHPSNVKMTTPTRHTPGNLLYDSFSGDYQLRSGGDASGSVQQAPKYRRLCKYGDKIKRVSSISLNGCHDRFGECNTANKDRTNQMKHAIGAKRKTKRHLDSYIDEEVEVSEDADVSEDEDDNQSEDKYEDSFIDDQATPTEFTQTEQGGRHNGDMMGFYRQSLLTQTPVVLPSRYLDVSDISASRTGNASCSSEARHNSTETPKEIQTHHTINPSPSYSFVQDQCETTIANCESSTKPDCRKRRLSFQQPPAIPVINLEPEPAPEPSSHVGTRVADHLYFDDDDFFENLDFDAIEAQAMAQLRQKTTQPIQKPVEIKKASDMSFAPPSFDLDLGF